MPAQNAEANDRFRANSEARREQSGQSFDRHAASAEQQAAARPEFSQEQGARATLDADDRPSFEAAKQEITGHEPARSDFTKGSAGVAPDPTARPEFDHQSQTELNQQAHERVIARNDLGY